MTGIARKLGFDRIRGMKPIWRMWRMVRKLRKLQKVYIERQRRGIVDVDQRNISYFSKLNKHVPRDNLVIKNISNDFINGTLEDFRNAPREDADKVEETIDNCIGAGFVKTHTDNQRLISLTKDGLKFADPFYGLKYLIKELGIVWTFSVSVIGSFAVGTGGFVLIKVAELIQRVLN
jgi:hypothetical protein